MTPSQTESLSEYTLAICMQCGAVIWNYSTPDGKHVALDNAPGPYIIINGDTAYRSEGTRGYRGHWDYCKLAASPLTGQVDGDDFLWA